MLNEVKVSVNQNNMIYVSKKFLKKSFKSNKVITKLFDLNHESILNNIEELVDLYIKTENSKLSIEQANKIKQIILIIKNFNNKHSFNLSF